jgi:hypothetical protein
MFLVKVQIEPRTFAYQATCSANCTTCPVVTIQRINRIKRLRMVITWWSQDSGLVITSWSRTWHSLLHTRWARHGIPAPRDMQVMHSGLHMVCAWNTWHFRDSAPLAPGRRFRTSPGHHLPWQRPAQQARREEACQLLNSICLNAWKCNE